MTRSRPCAYPNHSKESEVPEMKPWIRNCEFEIAWAGRCKRKAEADGFVCEEHAERECWCGDQAYRECDSFEMCHAYSKGASCLRICRAPLCATHHCIYFATNETGVRVEPHSEKGLSQYREWKRYQDKLEEMAGREP